MIAAASAYSRTPLSPNRRAINKKEIATWFWLLSGKGMTSKSETLTPEPFTTTAGIFDCKSFNALNKARSSGF